jgi:hypothetical protein
MVTVRLSPNNVHGERGRKRNFTTMVRKKIWREAMARNFGVPQQIDRHQRTPVWPTWLVTFAIKLGIVNPAKFPYRG